VTEQWDPATGLMTPLADGTQATLHLGPYGAMLFRAETADEPKRLGGDKPAGLSFHSEPFPPTPAPSVGQGQHVRSTLTGDNATGWCAAATLTKGQVDTHLFISFTCEQPVAWGECVGLMIDTSVPEGQRTPAELLVFIRTKDGGDYLAGTGRYLNEPGAGRAYVMFSQFKPFGQTTGALDLSQVTSLRVGWGGYFGAEGEKITLTVNPPTRFICGPE